MSFFINMMISFRTYAEVIPHQIIFKNFNKKIIKSITFKQFN